MEYYFWIDTKFYCTCEAHQCLTQDAAEINENNASKVLSVEPVCREHEININYIICSKI